MRIGGYKMDEEIAKNNELYMKNWISLNPNLKDITFSNNTLYTPDEKINFKNYSFKNNIKNNQWNKQIRQECYKIHDLSPLHTVIAKMYIFGYNKIMKKKIIRGQKN